MQPCAHVHATSRTAADGDVPGAKLEAEASGGPAQPCPAGRAGVVNDGAASARAHNARDVEAGCAS
jgi:hypothetical protein